MEAPTTGTQSFGHLLDEAHNVWDTFKSAYNCLAGVESTKFRLVVLVGSRIDLLAKAVDKGKLLWPEWTQWVSRFRQMINTQIVLVLLML